jgi:NADH dehydrogenase FAD-containing subunit
MPKKKLFIVGGGGLGMEVAQKLEKDKKGRELFDIFVFDKKKEMYNNISGLQACVEPDLVKGMLVPMDKALKIGRRVHAEVEACYPSGVDGRTKPSIKLKARGTAVECDYLVMASGTSYTFPGKVPWWIGSSACQRLYEKIRDNIAKAPRVAIVGGGPVGCELAGAIKSSFPEKTVKLIHKGPQLCSSVRGADVNATSGSQMEKKSGAEGGGKYCKMKTLKGITKMLEGIGCEVLLNEEVLLDEPSAKRDATLSVSSVIQKSIEKAKAAESSSGDTSGNPPSSPYVATSGETKENDVDFAEGKVSVDVTQFVSTRGAPKPKAENFMDSDNEKTVLKTKSGKEIETDLVFFCTGPISNSEVYENHYKLDYRGRVCVDDEMRCIPKEGETSNYVYAVGDCAGTRFDDEQNYTAGHEHTSTVVNNLIACELGNVKKMKPYKPSKHPMLALYMGRKAGIAEIFGMRFGKWLTHSLKSPEAIADMVWAGSNAGKPPKSEWSKKKKPFCGKKDARTSYEAGTVTGDDDW